MNLLDKKCFKIVKILQVTMGKVLCRIDYPQNMMSKWDQEAKGIVMRKKDLENLKIQLLILYDMVMEFNIGMMVLIMKDNGHLTKLKEKVLFGMQKEMFTTENLKMIWLMDMVNILILMDLNIKVNSKMMFKKDKEKKNG